MLREMVQRSAEIARSRGLKLATVFHAGDGNMHPNICYDRRDADEVERVLEAGRLILETCIAAGGSLTGEHGVGLEKLEHLGALFTQDDIETQCRVRRAWDPELRMNPGKLLPLRTCAEIHTAPLAPAGSIDTGAPSQEVGS